MMSESAETVRPDMDDPIVYADDVPVVGIDGIDQDDGQDGELRRAGEMLFSEELYSLHEPQSLAAETIAGLRNHLVSRQYAQNRRSLALCSPTASSGTAVIAANLAIAMAQSGLRTLLIDGNLRTPRMQELFMVDEPAEGLSEFLASRSADGPKLFGDVVPDLSLMFAGNPADNSADLLASTKFKTMIEESVRSFDITIIDCPPSANYSDCRRIATVVRNALIIARRDHTFASDVKTLAQDLQSDRVQVVGTFLNATK